jgi:hypothetical protein
MRTAMQLMVWYLENEGLEESGAYYKAKMLLEKEKEDLMMAFSDGQETPINHPTLPHYSREEYYNDNYNQD